MIQQSEFISARSQKSILIISDNQEFSQRFSGQFFNKDATQIHTEPTRLQAINGRATELSNSHDVVIFEALPDDAKEMTALGELLSKRDGDTVFLAMAKGNMTLEQVRRLRSLGVDEVLPMSITDVELNKVISDIRNSRKRTVLLTDPVQARPQGKVITVAQARGGIGATTVAVNLACKLASQRSRFKSAAPRRVALLDLDLQFGNANVLLDIEDDGAFQKMAEDGVMPDAHYTSGLMQSHDSGVDILSAPTSVIPLNSIEPEVIASLIDCLRAEYDYVVIDLPRALVDWLEPVIERADSMQIVTDTSVPCVRHSKRLIDFFRDIKFDLQIGLIANRETKTLLKSSQCREAEKLLECKFDSWLPDVPKIARKAADLGTPVTTQFGRSALAKAIGKLAKDIAAKTSKPTAKASANTTEKGNG